MNLAKRDTYSQNPVVSRYNLKTEQACATSGLYYEQNRNGMWGGPRSIHWLLWFVMLKAWGCGDG